VIDIHTARYGLFCYASTVNDYGDVIVARGLTEGHARARLMMRLTKAVEARVNGGTA
jgi:hypothetical protein